MPIKFGSDGWRGIIGQEFTLDNVARIAAAVCEWWPEDSGTYSGEVFISYDNREMSYEAACHVWRILKSLGKLSPFLSYEPRPSPYLAWQTHEFDRPLGIQITASHNPPNYNGIKLKAKYGGSLLTGEVTKVEAIANEISIPAIPAHLTYELGGDEFMFDEHDYESMMIDFGREYVEIDNLAPPSERRQFPAREKILIDHMHGATSIYALVLNQIHTVTGLIRADRDPTFGGSKPEPLEHLLPELIKRIKDASDGTVGIAFDGDGDRLAVIDETGAYLQSHEIFALLLDYLASQTRDGKRVYPGSKVVTTVSFSSLLGKIAASYGLETIEVPVGFKHVAEEMLRGDVLIGGEESGGAALGHYLPERDALLMALTLLRAKGEAGVTLHEMLRDIYSRFGRTEFVHEDVQLDVERAAELRARIPSLMEVQSVAGESVTSRSDKDGVKLRTGDGWVLVRASGTEPLARFYAEADSKEMARRMIADVKSKIL